MYKVIVFNREEDVFNYKEDPALNCISFYYDDQKEALRFVDEVVTGQYMAALVSQVEDDDE